MIDHLAKPPIKSGEISDWKRDLQTFAPLQNVSCKISGMVTEADFTNWKKEELKPYMDIVVETFGTQRIMYGSDWPVCLVAGDYSETLNITQEYFKSFSSSEQDMFFGDNAAIFYNL